MFLSAIFIILLHIRNSYLIENDCGCNVDRSKSNKMGSEKFKFQHENVNQCPVLTEDEYVNVVQPSTVSMSLIPAGEYQFGTNDVIIEGDNEGPRRLVKLKRFYLDKYEVTNSDFARFTAETNYKTEAESFGDSYVFTLFLNDTFKEQLKDYRVVQAPWWYKVTGADWNHPYGPDSSIQDVMDHPVIHVSWRDAQAFCSWRGARLPTEAEWEAACRGGYRDTLYPWGDKLFPNRQHMANIWQGTFPNHNSVKDGYIGTSPAQMYPANEFELYNMAGNVWEWTVDIWSSQTPQEKVKKGGSYLCHRSYCYRYRCSSRSHNTEDSSAGNLGFRCAKSA